MRNMHVSGLQKLGPMAGLLLMVILLAIISQDFLSITNIFNIFRQISINALLAFGMTLVILTGGIDLSVGSILALAGVLTASMVGMGLPPWLAILLGICTGALMGSINGLFIAIGRVAPFIVTLATLSLYRGLTLVYTDGRPLLSDNPDFVILGQGYLFEVPVPVIWMLVLFFLLSFLLKNTPFGRHIYALGGNEEAALLSGVRTTRVKIMAYTLCGAFASLAGIILTARLSSAQPTMGSGYELSAIAAVVLGGTSLAGGKGWITGTLIGAMIIGVLDNGLNLLNVSTFYQQVVKGAVILLAVLVDRSEKS